MKLTLDFKDAYLCDKKMLNDVRAVYSKTGGGTGKLITIGAHSANYQAARTRGSKIDDPRQHEISEDMAENIIQLLTGKAASVPPRDQGWMGKTRKIFNCEPRKKTFFGG